MNGDRVSPVRALNGLKAPFAMEALDDWTICWRAEGSRSEQQAHRWAAFLHPKTGDPSRRIDNPKGT